MCEYVFICACAALKEIPKKLLETGRFSPCASVFRTVCASVCLCLTLESTAKGNRQRRITHFMADERLSDTEQNNTREGFHVSSTQTHKEDGEHLQRSGGFENNES